MPTATKFALILAIVIAQPICASPTVSDALKANRSPLTLTADRLSGDGAVVIAKAVSSATIVALGEDHMSKEIPAFGKALCTMMADDLANVIVEAGPIATAKVEAMLHRQDSARRMTAFVRQYPNAVAFLDSQAEFEFAAHCTRHARLIGIDQEFMGAASLVIDNILTMKLSPMTRQAFLQLKADDVRRSAQAAVSGDPAELTLLALSDAEYERYAGLLERGGTVAARDQFAALRLSHDIYEKNAAGTADANLTRALMMKRIFAANIPAGERTLIKLGDWHLYKGANPLNERDIGNTVAEATEVRGASSLHILILGTAGQRAGFAGYARPPINRPFTLSDDADYMWSKTASDLAFDGSWTVFDLRPMRQARLQDISPQWRRVVDGYDLLVLIPELHPAKMVGQADQSPQR